MLRSLPTKSFLALLAAAVVLVAIVGVLIEYAHERTQLRIHAVATTGGDPRRGEAMFIQYGCGSCHAAKGVRTATGMVGPPMDGVALRMILAGHLANTPANMQRWIRDPQQVSPGTAMPDLNVGETDARDITAFLYTRAK
jgi:cytochrome c2